jgi:tetratricopeptide (TPR) repeat protein
MKIQTKIIICFLLCGFKLILFSQSGLDEVGLKLALSNAKHDTTVLRIKCELGELNQILRVGLWDSLRMECEALMAKQSKGNAIYRVYQKQQITILNNIGFVFGRQGNNTKAIEYCLQSIKLAEEINDKSSVASSYSNLGGIYMGLGEIPKAFIYHEKALKISESLNDKSGIAESLGHLGGLYDNLGNKPKALEYFLLGLKFREEAYQIKNTNKNHAGVAYALNNVGLSYYSSGEKLKGITHLESGLKILKSINDKYGLANILNTFGNIYSEQGDFSLAIEKFEQSLKLKEEISDYEGIAYSYISIGELYFNQAEIKKKSGNKLWADSMLHIALENYNKSLNIAQQINDKDAISNVLIKLAHVLIKQQKTDEALKYLTRALTLSKELGYPINISNASMLLYDIYKKQNKLSQALEMYELSVQMRNRTNSEESQRATSALQNKYEFEKYEMTLKADQEKKDILHADETKQHKLIICFVIVGMLIVIIFSIFLLKRFKITQRQKKIIEKQKLEVDHAYSELHEKNKEVLDSITYARRIQRSLLTSEKYIDKHLNRMNKD